MNDDTVILIVLPPRRVDAKILSSHSSHFFLQDAERGSGVFGPTLGLRISSSLPVIFHSIK